MLENDELIGVYSVLRTHEAILANGRTTQLVKDEYVAGRPPGFFLSGKTYSDGRTLTAVLQPVSVRFVDFAQENEDQSDTASWDRYVEVTSGQALWGEIGAWYEYLHREGRSLDDSTKVRHLKEEMGKVLGYPE